MDLTDHAARCRRSSSAGTHVGGCDELIAPDQRGELMPLLQASLTARFVRPPRAVLDNRFIARARSSGLFFESHPVRRDQRPATPAAAKARDVPDPAHVPRTRRVF